MDVLSSPARILERLGTSPDGAVQIRWCYAAVGVDFVCIERPLDTLRGSIGRLFSYRRRFSGRTNNAGSRCSCLLGR